jgi:ADP-ribose pyrophosphatase
MTEIYPAGPDPVTEALVNVTRTMQIERIATEAGAALFRHEAAAIPDHPRYYDPESPRDVDYSKRPSYMGPYSFDSDGAPINPVSTKGIKGRGTLYKWGPNNAADPVVVATDPATNKRRLLLIRRDDTGAWALPGGNVDPGEHVSNATVRELQEEAGIDLRDTESEVIYEGYVDDPRNTDNAWFETAARLFRLDHAPQPQAGDDAAEARWFDCNDIDELRDAIRALDRIDPSVEPLYASHADIIAEALRRL